MDNAEKIRVIIQFLVNSGDNLGQITEKLQKVYRDACPCRSTISKWYHFFKQGGTETATTPSPGRPLNPVNDRLLTAITKAIEANPKISLSLLSADLGESKGYLQHIINTRLQFRKVLAKWVPKLPSEQQRQARIDNAKSILKDYADNQDHFLDNMLTVDETWVYYEPAQNRLLASKLQLPGQKPPEVGRIRNSYKKTLATVFWDRNGIVHIDYLATGKSINKEYYTNLLDTVHAKIPLRRRSKVIFLQVNCPAHKAKLAMEKIAQFRQTVVAHPPYSPDLAPSDYYLFRNLKNDLLKTKIDSASQVQVQVNAYFEAKSEDWFFSGFDMFKTQLTNVILNKGGYF